MELQTEYNKLEKRTNLPNAKFADAEINDEVHSRGEFRTQDAFGTEYLFDVWKDDADDEVDEYNGRYPYYSASSLPGICKPQRC